MVNYFAKYFFFLVRVVEGPPSSNVLLGVGGCPSLTGCAVALNKQVAPACPWSSGGPVGVCMGGRGSRYHSRAGGQSPSRENEVWGHKSRLSPFARGEP